MSYKSPKEKAQELVIKFEHPMGYVYLKRVIAKQCALLAVGEIIESRKEDKHFDDSLAAKGSDYFTPHPTGLTYWLQTIEHIKNHE